MNEEQASSDPYRKGKMWSKVGDHIVVSDVSAEGTNILDSGVTSLASTE